MIAMLPPRPLRALALALASALLLTVPADAEAQGTRRKPRVTAPSDDAAEAEAPRKKRTRRNAAPIDEDEFEPDEQPASVAPAVAPARDPDELPRGAKVIEVPTDDAPAPRFREELPERSDDTRAMRTRRTAEEELGDGEGPAREELRLALLDEPGTGFSVELAGGALLLDSPRGAKLGTGTAGFGAHATWQLGRLFAPENEFLHRGILLDVSYLHARGGDGTKEISVASQFHHLSAAALVGYPLGSLPLTVLFYGKLGPSLHIMPVSYAVQGVETDFTGVRAGLAYGAGVRTTYYFGRVGIAARVEALRYRRGYLDDTMLGGGLGVAF